MTEGHVSGDTGEGMKGVRPQSREKRQFVRTEAFIDAVRGAPPIDPLRFRRDVDRYLNQALDPRPAGGPKTASRVRPLR